MEAQGLRLLAAWRGAGRPVIHVKHNSALPNSTLRPGQPGNAFKPGFEPLAGEALIEKTVNAAFIGTALEGELRARGIEQIVAFGIATDRSEEHTSELQSLMRISYAVFCLKKKKNTHQQ